MTKRTLMDINVQQQRVLVRMDYNIPIEAGTERIIAYDHRLRASLPTISYLMGSRSKIILCSHLGRPNGTVDEDLRLSPVAHRLSALLPRPVQYVDECIGPKAEQAVKHMSESEILLLENLRFDPGEEGNSSEFAHSLASLADVFIMDAFGVAHRSHASTVGVPSILPSASGFLLQREIDHLGRGLTSPQRPFGAILGGAKVSDKIKIVETLINNVDILFIGGSMATTFLHAKGYSIGSSGIETDCLDVVKSLLNLAKKNNVSIYLPTDVVIAEIGRSPAQHTQNVPVEEVPKGWAIMDIGRRTIDMFKEHILECQTIMWNGPMGVFEFPQFAEGTTVIAQTLASIPGTTLVGGGSTAEAVEQMGLVDRMTHVSTGGGASLEFLEGKKLPGIDVLPELDIEH